MRLPAVLLAALAAGLPGAAAQTTPTERAAARDILQQIDRLQARLQPSATARRLAQAKNADRDRVLRRVEQLWTTELQGVSDWIGRNPEVGFEEVKAVDTLTKLLRAHGFRLESGQAGLATAFVGTWDSPAGTNGPTLGVILEYDALRGTQGAFHGDQHNAQGPVAIAAAVALAEYMKEQGIPGRVRAFGTPAEEVGPPSKAMMLDAGAFRGTDILVRSHGSSETSRSRPGFGVCCLNINEVKYIFTGRPAHQRDSWNGRNALEAAVHFYMAVDGLRSTFRPETSIQGIIPEGGAAPNVVPDRAVVDYYLRYPDEVYLDHVDSMVANAARGAALMTGTQVKIENYGRYRDGITLGTLEELTFAYAQTLGAPRISTELDRPAGYEETGVVSRVVPGVGVSVFSSPAAGHSYEREKDTFTAVGHTGFLLDAKIMAGALYHFLTDAPFRSAVRDEHREMVGLLERYLAALREAYRGEVGAGPVSR
ncbi:MAG TPA: peptidase dimerization domain-containing protein [Gemmatimonadales bacterium]